MVRLHCARCGHGWDYTGSSDHYCTCPNCKTSVKIQDSKESAESGTGGPETERVDAIENRLAEVDELAQSLRETQGETVPELQGEVSENTERLDELGEAVEEVAGAVAELVEAMGGTVEWESGPLVDADPDPVTTVPEAVRNADIYDPTEEGS